MLSAIIRVVGWTVLQAVVFLVVFEGGKWAWEVLNGWSGGIGRGILWWYYAQFFVGLAAIANAVLAVDRIGSVQTRRAAVWGLVMLSLVAYTLPGWQTLPLAVPFAHICTLSSIGIREVLERLVVKRSHSATPRLP